MPKDFEGSLILGVSKAQLIDLHDLHNIYIKPQKI